MAYDPNYPIDDSNIKAFEFRNQFHGIKDLIDAVPAGAKGEKGDKGDPGVGLPGQNGSDGQPGQNGADGRSLNPRGEWDGMTTYNRLDLVTYSGNMFLCNTAAPAAQPRHGFALDTGASHRLRRHHLPRHQRRCISGRVMIQQSEMHVMTNNDTGSGEEGIALRADTSTGTPLPILATRRSGMDIAAIKLDFAGTADGMGNPSVQHGDLYVFDGMSQSVKPFRGVTQDVQVSDGNGGFLTFHIVSGIITSVTAA